MGVISQSRVPVDGWVTQTRKVAPGEQRSGFVRTVPAADPGRCQIRRRRRYRVRSRRWRYQPPSIHASPGLAEVKRGPTLAATSSRTSEAGTGRSGIASGVAWDVRPSYSSDSMEWDWASSWPAWDSQTTRSGLPTNSPRTSHCSWALSRHTLQVLVLPQVGVDSADGRSGARSGRVCRSGASPMSPVPLRPAVRRGRADRHSWRQLYLDTCPAVGLSGPAQSWAGRVLAAQRRSRRRLLRISEQCFSSSVSGWAGSGYACRSLRIRS